MTFMRITYTVVHLIKINRYFKPTAALC